MYIFILLEYYMLYISIISQAEKNNFALCKTK